MEQNMIELMAPESAGADAGKALRRNDVLYLFACCCKL
jgi:hypothetical protein